MKQVKPGWGVNLGGWRWHRVDLSKSPVGDISFCGVGISTLEGVENNPYWTGTNRLADVLTGRVDAPVCKKCAR